MIELKRSESTKNINKQWLEVHITHNKTIYSIISFTAIGIDSLTKNFIVANIKPNANIIYNYVYLFFISSFV